MVGDRGFVARDLAPLMPELGPPLGPQDAVEAGPEERFRLFDAATRLMCAAAARDGLVIVLDDLHWADSPSLLLLLHLVRHLERVDARVLLVATYRDTEATPHTVLGDLLPEVIRGAAGERLRLRGLGEHAVQTYLGAVSHQQVPPVIAQRVHELTGGNPFFVGELTGAEGGRRAPVCL